LNGSTHFSNFMKYGFPLLCLSVLFVFLARVHTKLAVFFLWTALSSAIVGVAYIGPGERVFNKSREGRQHWANVILLLPYLLINWGAWRLGKMLSKEDCYNEIVPGLYLGRRALLSELPDDVRSVVDLTAEFPAPKHVAETLTYISCPLLDGTGLRKSAFAGLIQETQKLEKGIYLHCAAGHGRSAMVAAALLMAYRDAGTLTDAEAILKAKRPRVHINRSQRKALHKLLKGRGTNS